MNTITNYQLYKLALNELMNRRAHEEEINNRTIEERGRQNRVSVSRMKMYDAQITELHDAIINIEAE